MKKGRGISPRHILCLLLLAVPGWNWAAGALSNPLTVIGFASPPVVVEALGMGNAVVADGTLFNASAYNPALLANQSDFFEGHLGFNISNDIVNDVSGFINNNSPLINSFNALNGQNINQYFTEVTNSFQVSGQGVSIDYQNYNKGVTGIQGLVNNLQTGLNYATNQTLQVGAGLNFAFKIDDHIGFQVYNTTQAAVQVGRGSLVQALLNMAALPTLPASADYSNVQQAAVSMYNNIKTLIDPVLGSQAATLGAAVTWFEGQPASAASVSQFAVTVSSVLSSINTTSAEQTLFNQLIPIEVMTYSDTVLVGTYCLRPLDEDKALSVGVNLKAINRRIAAISSSYLSTQNINDASNISNDLQNDIKQSTWRWGMDLGVLYEFSDPKVSVGASATDLLHNTASLDTNTGDPLYGVVTDPAPTDIRVGASFKPIRELTLNCDLDDLLNNTTYYQGLNYLYHVDFGFNYNLIYLLQLRGGVTNGNLCGGIGFLQFLQYAYAVNSLTQSYNHYLQFDLAF